jgi:hypothetical protein
MSEQIGPIHNWVFNKIKFQEKEVATLLALSDKVNVDDVAGTVEKGNLIDIVNTPNIHAFLQERIHITERRLAMSVESLLKNGFTLEDIKKTLFDFGAANAFDSAVSAPKAYELLSALMVSGMPCDRIESVEEKSETRIIFKENKDIHTEFWNDKSLYQVLKDEVIKGLLSRTALSYSHKAEREFVIEEN